MRSIRMSSMRGSKFQCGNTTCLPFVNLITTTIMKCQMACLAQIYCRAASFHQSTSNCELFTDISNEIPHIVTDTDITTMIVIAGTRSPPEPTTTTSTTTTSTTTTSTTTTTTTTTSKTTTTTTTTTSTTTTSTTTTPCVRTGTYSQSFSSGDASTAQCTAWSSFVVILNCSSYSSIRIFGSIDGTGLSVSNSVVATVIVVALRTNATYTGVSDGYTWAVGSTACGLEISSTGNLCLCSAGYTLRPCHGASFGGINGPTCGAASQTISLSFQ
ncbi:unnamed protein product [Adineta steineri]|uniref:Apple domain-containing protein n=1 Tax=Adineta steineri TaxID=433720 RepID=A0A813QA07_9BILA|nr:unnamed protein product [Adineta steineri]CAF0766361.1 unnamed protein product [Adineta steineri]CAF0923618.1 unnamed protein product [Adineta steineri]